MQCSPYPYISHPPYSTSQPQFHSISQYQYLPDNSVQYHKLIQYLNHHILCFPQHNFQNLHSITNFLFYPHNISNHNLNIIPIYLSRHSRSMATTRQDNIYIAFKFLYMKIIVFERHPIACFI